MPQQTKRSRSGGWDEMYALARDYARENGTLLVPGDYEVAGRRLGAWIGTQRYDCKAGSNPFLTPERKEKLDAIGMVWDVREHRFQYMCNRLRAYIVDFGDARVPQSYVTPEGDKLGVWLNRVRMSEKEGKLSGAQRAQLEELGVIWQPEALRRSVWDVRYAQAMAYRKENGAFPPADYVTPEGDRLGLWLANQRRLAHTGRLLPERRALLSAAGLVWEPAQALWQARYEQAKEYFLAHGHLRVAKRPGVREDLGTWLSTQRRNYILGTNPLFTDERRRRLEEIGIVWDAATDSAALWEEWYGKAAAYYRQHGHLCPEKGPLRTWVLAQRAAKKGKRGSLSEQQIRRLEAVGMQWDPQEEQWFSMYRRAQAYYEVHRMLNVPCGYITEDGARLGQWVARQRAAYRNFLAGRRGGGRCVMTVRHAALLNRLEMIWDGDRVTAHTSFREKALLFYLRKAFLDAGKVTRRQRFGVELDIYLPSVRTAIEYDGCRWHADRLRQDEEKAAVCLGLGIRLIRIREPGLPAVTQCGRTVVLEDLSDTAFERAVSGLLAELGVEQTDVNLARDGRDILAQYRDVTARAWDRNY